MNQNLEWLNVPAAALDENARAGALARQQELTKPRGALGRLEALAVQLAAMQGRERPCADRVAITVFAGDHGVAAEGISAFPQSVTAEMIKNFARGGAAISVAAKALGAVLEVVDLGTVVDAGPLDGVKRYALGPGTANFVAAPAMSEHQFVRALAAGRHAAERARLGAADLFIGGEMGIGNTSAATALACALLDEAPDSLAGPGTGLDADGIAHKIAVLDRALAYHGPQVRAPQAALRRLGGFELAALAGSYIACAQMGLPALVDGFISSAAALAAIRLHPGTADWLILAHASAEPGHRRLVAAIGQAPLLDLGMRLGEGTGAAVAVPLLRMACALHNDMATFAEAEVSAQL